MSSRSAALVVFVVAAACGIELEEGTRVTVRVGGASALSDDDRAFFAAHDLALWLDMVELVACDDDERLALARRARRFARQAVRHLHLIPRAHAAHLEETPRRALLRTSLRALDEAREWVILSPPAQHICGVRVGAYGDGGPVLTLEDEIGMREVSMAFERTFTVDIELAVSPRVEIDIRFGPDRVSLDGVGDSSVVDDTALVQLASASLTLERRIQD
jgi:hypothetical protein